MTKFKFSAYDRNSSAMNDIEVFCIDDKNVNIIFNGHYAVINNEDFQEFAKMLYVLSCTIKNPGAVQSLNNCPGSDMP